MQTRSGVAPAAGVVPGVPQFGVASRRLALPLPEFEAIAETGAMKRWQSWTPAMAAGWTDQVWRLRKVLLDRVPPWLQPQVR